MLIVTCNAREMHVGGTESISRCVCRFDPGLICSIIHAWLHHKLQNVQCSNMVIELNKNDVQSQAKNSKAELRTVKTVLTTISQLCLPGLSSLPFEH